jgi:hypothetical protein
MAEYNLAERKRSLDSVHGSVSRVRIRLSLLLIGCMPLCLGKTESVLHQTRPELAVRLAYMPLVTVKTLRET